MAIAGLGGIGMNSQMYSRTQKTGNKPLINGNFMEQKIETERKAPYSYLADENGMIQYRGVTFYCDDEKQSINLGDVSKEEEVLRIPLEDGGCLNVNRENLGELSRAITMFSPGDIKRILSAIARDAQCTRKMNEIEDMENTAVDAVDEN